MITYTVWCNMQTDNRDYWTEAYTGDSYDDAFHTLSTSHGVPRVLLISRPTTGFSINTKSLTYDQAATELYLFTKEERAEDLITTPLT